MSTNSSTTTAGAPWFPSGPEPNDGWRVDAATLALLAIIGDPQPEELTRAMTASRLAMLPRLVPAMQLLNAARPACLPPTKATISEIRNVPEATVVRDESVGYFVEALHQLSRMPAYGFRAVQVRHSEKKNRDVERHGRFRMATLAPSRLVRCVLLFSFLLIVGLFVAAILWRDGPAITTIAMMGLASSLMGYASGWRPVHAYMERNTSPSDEEALAVLKVIAIRGTNFLVVRCSEDVSDELYLGCMDECWYRTEGIRYPILMAAGTVALMISVVLIGNCTWKSQFSIACSYIVLNALHWSVSVLHRRSYWDMGRYGVDDVTPTDALDAHKHDPSSVEKWRAFTRTLWYAIREVGSTEWVEEAFFLPQTEPWKRWLAEAQQAVDEGNRAWPAVAKEQEIMSLND